MLNSRWTLLDTETTGFAAPVFVVELAAQRMQGWNPDGEPFRKLLNQNADIPAEVSRVHGYTREILERDGEPPHEVYREFAEYTGGLPLVAFNLEYDLDDVLTPEWARLRIAAIGRRGLCALRLAQRLLDPVPAGNCKLQTLRQYYRLPERGAHTALGDVQTVADLFAQVLRPIAEHRGLDTWEKLAAYAAEEWFPSRIAFGKHKGRLIQEARHDAVLRRWLDWLAGSSNARSARMGRWYLQQLEITADPSADGAVFAAPEMESIGERPGAVRAAGLAALVIYVNPELEQLRQLVAGARARLAELESGYTREKSRVDAMQAALFRRLREHYQKRDRLRLVLDYRKKYLDLLLRGGEEEAKQAEADYEQARTQADKDYEETAAAVADKKQLTPDEEAELNRLWKKLVKLYHPDRFAHEPDKLATYEKLTAAINRAKDNGDMAALREIAEDPHGFILRQGWASLDFTDEIELAQLRRLHETLQLEIVAVIESLNQLRESPDYELCQISEQKPGVLEELAAERAALLTQESAELEVQASRLAKEIKELGGVEGARIL
ncbi:MAG TPA: exonuclease domain-containing protein [Candidatus Limnocylindria bacterium]|nr:exonuclease domain-containing protein [Candidatus Limnocylindria bacterium]